MHLHTPDGHGAKSTSQLLQRHKLLAQLPDAEQQLILPRLRYVAIEPRDILFSTDQPIEHCYFPLHGVVSLTAVMSDGHTSEVGVVGTEGFVGIPIALGEECSGHEAIVQVGPCDALRITSADLRDCCKQCPDLNALLLRYANALLVMTAQASACNALHTAEERLARWLLMVQDRVEKPEFQITHEFLSVMIGTRRATVTVIAGALERAQIIELGRGEVRIINCAKLEDASCECYWIMRKAMDRVAPPSSRPSAIHC